MKGLPVLETGRLVLRPWRDDDAEALLALHGDREVVRGGPGAVLSDPAEARLRVRRYQDVCRPPLGSWAVTLRGGPVVGRGLLDHAPDASGEDSDDVELGWELLRAQWGRGLALELGEALVRHGFDTARLDAIHLLVEPASYRAVDVARRLGFRSRGTTRAYYGATLEQFVLEESPSAAWPRGPLRAGSRRRGSSPERPRPQPRTRG